MFVCLAVIFVLPPVRRWRHVWKHRYRQRKTGITKRSRITNIDFINTNLNTILRNNTKTSMRRRAAPFPPLDTYGARVPRVTEPSPQCYPVQYIIKPEHKHSLCNNIFKKKTKGNFNIKYSMFSYFINN